MMKIREITKKKESNSLLVFDNWRIILLKICVFTFYMIILNSCSLSLYDNHSVLEKIASNQVGGAFIETLIKMLPVGIILAILAIRKGYNIIAWVFAGEIFGLIILAFLPFVNKKSKKTEEEKESKKMKGDIIGIVLSAVTLVIIYFTLTNGFKN